MRAWFVKICLMVFCVVATSAAFGQGADPEKERTRSKPKPAVAKPKPATTQKTKATVTKPLSTSKKTARNPKAKTGSIEITISEPEAQVYLTKVGGTNSDSPPITSPGDGSPVRFDDIAAGSYALTVKKANFDDFTQAVQIVAGKIESRSIKLTSSVAFLNVDPGVADAEISIDGLDTYNGSVKRLAVRPGTYSITVKRRGYVTQTQKVSITARGIEKTVKFDMKPVPIAEMLVEAEQELAKQNYDRAADLADGVLAIEQDNQRALFIKGMARFLAGSDTAGPFLAASIRNGGSVRLPVRLFTKDKGTGLIEGELIIDRASIAFTSQRSDLNFFAAKTAVSEVAAKLDDAGTSYVYMKAAGTFAGKSAMKKVMIYAASAALRSGGKQTFCPQISGGNPRCSSDAANIYSLIETWTRDR